MCLLDTYNNNENHENTGDDSRNKKLDVERLYYIYGQAIKNAKDWAGGRVQRLQKSLSNTINVEEEETES